MFSRFAHHLLLLRYPPTPPPLAQVAPAHCYSVSCHISLGRRFTVTHRFSMGLRSGELGGQESNGSLGNFVFSGPLCQFALFAKHKAKGLEKWNKVKHIEPLQARVCQSGICTCRDQESNLPARKMQNGNHKNHTPHTTTQPQQATIIIIA